MIDLNNETIYSDSGSNGDNKYYPRETNITSVFRGQYIKIRREAIIVTLCEVEVFGGKCFVLQKKRNFLAKFNRRANKKNKFEQPFTKKTTTHDDFERSIAVCMQIKTEFYVMVFFSTLLK